MEKPSKKNIKPGVPTVPKSTASEYRTTDLKDYQDRMKSFDDSLTLNKGYLKNKKVAKEMGMVRKKSPAQRNSGGTNLDLTAQAESSLTGEANYFNMLSEKSHKKIKPVAKDTYGFEGDPNTFQVGNFKRPSQKVRLVKQEDVDLQQKLKDDGFYTGDVDGIIGDGTRKAIEEFEKAKNKPKDTPLPPTDIPDNIVPVIEPVKEKIEPENKSPRTVKGRVEATQKAFDSKIKKGYKQYTYKSR